MIALTARARALTALIPALTCTPPRAHARALCALTGGSTHGRCPA